MAKATAKKDPFKETIEAHLKERAKQDPLFAKSLEKPKKNIDDCISYIYSTVQKSGRKGFNDDEIFNMAAHYYDEDDIKAGSKQSGSVIVNHVVELTEEDKAKAKEKAIEQATAELKEQAKKELKVDVQLSEEEIAEAKQVAFQSTVEETKKQLVSKKQKQAAKKQEGNREEPIQIQPSLF